MTWLDDLIRDCLSNDANEEEVRHKARIYMMLLTSGVLFPGTSSSHVHLMLLQLLEDFDQKDDIARDLHSLRSYIDIYAEHHIQEYHR